MIERAISWALKQRLIIIIFVVALVAFGIYAYTKLPIDAFPDVTNKQVQIITEAPGRSPEEVEKYITYPVEAQMMGIPKLTDTRSLSGLGLRITVILRTGDIYFAPARP
jgi:cobalt-zinc-cadmium resistance protein CzcA